MFRVFMFLSLFGFSTLWLNPSSYANPSCSTCLTEVEERERVIQCKEGHLTHQECLHDQIKKTEDVFQIKAKGLRCNGLCNSSSSSTGSNQCSHVFSFDEFRNALDSTQIEQLDKRLTAAFKPTDQWLFNQDVHRISQGIIEAFIPCCPAEGCGGSLDQIAGCNAATCSSEDCKTTFCYLCLKEEANNQAAHAHVRGHSGDYWDHRPGYPARYHWLLARKELANLLKRKVDPAVMDRVLNSQKVMLEERNMWPFPAGKKTAQWLQEVRDNAQLSPEKRIELLQNEAIYRRQIKDTKRGALVETEIRRLEGKVLASLDLRDAQGVDLQPAVQVAAAPVLQAQRVPVAGGQLNQGGNILPILQDDPRIAQAPQFFALGPDGRTYQVGNLIWSGVALNRMGQEDAERFCEDRGARLPTKEEWEGLARVMGYPLAYNRNLILDMAGNCFYSSSVNQHNAEIALIFFGNEGNISHAYRQRPLSVRCVR